MIDSLIRCIGSIFAEISPPVVVRLLAIMVIIQGRSGLAVYLSSTLACVHQMLGLIGICFNHTNSRNDSRLLPYFFGAMTEICLGQWEDYQSDQRPSAKLIPSTPGPLCRKPFDF